MNPISRTEQPCGCVDYQYPHDTRIYRLKWCDVHYKQRVEEMGYTYNAEADQKWKAEKAVIE